MVILACMDSVRVSGPARQLLSLATSGPGAGFEVRLGLFCRGTSRTPLVEGATALGLDVRILPSRWPADPAAVVALARLAREQDVAVLQTHGYKANVFAWLARRSIRRPWIAFLHGVTTESRRAGLYYALERLAVRQADRVVVMSERMRREYEAAGVGASRLRVVHNAILPGVTVPRPQDTAERGPALSVVGRLSAEKGVDVALEAMAVIAAQHPTARLHIAGDGPDRASLTRLASRLGIGDCVVWHGHVEDVASIYRQSTLLIIPSRSEGLPNVALEAMAAGVPVVATDVGGLGELITSGQTGVLIPPEDPSALARAIRQLLDRADERRRLASAAHAYAIERFSLTARVAAFHGLYTELLLPSPDGAARASQ
ncbi:MAG TPA: glycosyltransferase [Candidatus Acidoferrum sp.]|nr:glycosyltransferase [Candidatus Acidoferrum sp.]